MIITITGPTCSGKTTLQDILVEEGFAAVPTTTTRPMRESETPDSANFIDKSMFKRLDVQGAFVETNEYAGNYYGKTIKDIETALRGSVPSVAIFEPKGLRRFRHVADKRGWQYRSVFICNPVSVIVERYMQRVVKTVEKAMSAGDKPDLTAHVNRMSLIIDEEFGWAQEAANGIVDYDSCIWKFDETNQRSIVRHVKQLAQSARVYQD